MSLMLNFCVGLINALAAFLAAEPIIYIVGALFGLIVVRVIFSLMHSGRR